MAWSCLPGLLSKETCMDLLFCTYHTNMNMIKWLVTTIDSIENRNRRILQGHLPSSRGKENESTLRKTSSAVCYEAMLSPRSGFSSYTIPPGLDIPVFKHAPTPTLETRETAECPTLWLTALQDCILF